MYIEVICAYVYIQQIYICRVCDSTVLVRAVQCLFVSNAMPKLSPSNANAIPKQPPTSTRGGGAARLVSLEIRVVRGIDEVAGEGQVHPLCAWEEGDNQVT